MNRLYLEDRIEKLERKLRQLGVRYKQDLMIACAGGLLIGFLIGGLL